MFKEQQTNCLSGRAAGGRVERRIHEEASTLTIKKIPSSWGQKKIKKGTYVDNWKIEVQQK